MEIGDQSANISYPAILANPSAIEKVVRRRVSRIRPVRTMAEILIPSLLPVQEQLSREHLDALRDEITAAEDVLLNIYEDLELFKKRQSALNDVTYLLVRMKDNVDQLAISPVNRESLREQIDWMKKQIDYIIDSARHNAIPLLKPIQKFVSLPGDETASTNKADVVFLIDRSAKMKRDGSNIAKEMHVLYHGLLDRDVDLQLGLQSYERSSQPIGPMRKELDEFITDIDSIFFNGETRNTLTAIRETLTDQNFRPDAKKFIVVFADAEPHDDYGNAREETITLAKESGVSVFMVSSCDWMTGNRFASYENMAAATDGRCLDINKTTFDIIMASLAEMIAARMAASGASIRESHEHYVQIGPKQSDSLTVQFADINSDMSGIKEVPLDSEDDFKIALNLIDTALSKITLDRSDKKILQDNLFRILSFFDGARTFKLDFTF